MYIRQLPKETSPAGKDYWLAVEIESPETLAERDTKRIPLSAIKLNDGKLEAIADNGDTIQLNFYYINTIDGKKNYRMEIDSK